MMMMMMTKHISNIRTPTNEHSHTHHILINKHTNAHTLIPTLTHTHTDPRAYTIIILVNMHFQIIINLNIKVLTIYI